MSTEGRRFDTPERVAGLERELRRVADKIENRNVQFQYRIHLRQQVNRQFTFRRDPRGRRDTEGIRIPSGTSPEALRRSAHRFVMATLLRHPPLIEEFDERLASLDIEEGQVDSLLRKILVLVHDAPGLDEDGLKSHLSGTDAELAGSLLRADVYVQWRFAGPDATIESAREGVSHALDGLGLSGVKADLAAAQTALENDPSAANLERLIKLKEALELLGSENAMPAEDPGSGAAFGQLRQQS